nr:class I SAM-dependent methyltransferase [Kibdelosporangium sp. MJ126-NF4]CEL17999.1 Non-ribosomal peptide synthetase [Kibdelosporangium sp. MJ126-NF4]CTQ90773.1 Non-ribosomal peptide synthetase [Kibdelosporangium sp. MJ126-NF4]
MPGIGEVLQSHPYIDRAAVLGDDNRSLVAYVQPGRADVGAAVEVDHADLTRDYVEEWQSVYDYVYSGGPAGDGRFDVRGWTSSYTGAELSEEDMREWVEQTVSRVRGLGAKRILELGCGTGLLLHRLLDSCDAYFASDVSATAIDRIRESFGGTVPSSVRLAHAGADEPGFVPPGAVDAAMINSVAQYFLDESYLTSVLAAAAERVDRDGLLFIGDIRSAALNRAFSAGVELARADPGATREQIQALAERRCCTGTELLIDPGYFVDLAAAIPRVAHVEIRLKRGQRPTEMTRFRFDAVIHLDSARHDIVAVDDWRQWASLQQTEQLLSGKPETLGFLSVPNARTITDHTAATLLQRLDGPATADEVRQAAADASGVDPEDLWALADKHGYTLQLSWARSTPDGSFDAAFVRAENALVAFPTQPVTARQHTNRIWHVTAENLDLAQLRDYLREQRPSGPVPARFVVLEELPLRADGEVDLAALAAVNWA